jgi:hypothetical protein
MVLSTKLTCFHLLPTIPGQYQGQGARPRRHLFSRSTVLQKSPRASRNTACRPNNLPGSLSSSLLRVRGDGSGTPARRPVSGRRHGRHLMQARVNGRGRPPVEERAQVHIVSDVGPRASHISCSFVWPRIAPPTRAAVVLPRDAAPQHFHHGERRRGAPSAPESATTMPQQSSAMDSRKSTLG